MLILRAALAVSPYRAAAGAGMGHVHGAGTAAGAHRQRNEGCALAAGSWASHTSAAVVSLFGCLHCFVSPPL